MCEQGGVERSAERGEDSLLPSDAGDTNGKGKGALRRVLVVGIVVVCATILVGISTKEDGETWNEWSSDVAEAASATSIAAHLSSYVSPPRTLAPESAPPTAATAEDCHNCAKRAQMHQARLQTAGEQPGESGERHE